MTKTPELTATPTTQTLPAVGRYRIDPNRSTICFATRHLFGLAPVRGTFRIAAGVIDRHEPVTDSIVQVEVDAASFTTGSRARDAVVAGPRFLDSASNPTFTFAAERLDGGAEGVSLPGTLTIRGVTAPVTLQVTGWEPGPRPSGAGSFMVEASARIDRREFGVTASRGMAGRYLDLSVTALCLPG